MIWYESAKFFKNLPVCFVERAQEYIRTPARETLGQTHLISSIVFGCAAWLFFVALVIIVVVVVIAEGGGDNQLILYRLI